MKFGDMFREGVDKLLLALLGYFKYGIAHFMF